jgi:nucleotide-binding universal stress UspA family protein
MSWPAACNAGATVTGIKRDEGPGRRVTLIPVAVTRPGATIRRTGTAPLARSAPDKESRKGGRAMAAPIVAGTDGSEESLAAVEWAAVAAARRRIPLCLVHVVEHHAGSAAHAQILGHDSPHLAWARHGLPHGARSALARASRRAADAAPGVDLRTAAVFGRADQVLTAISDRAPLLAIGTRGTGACSGQRLGSVAICLASRARCPVVFTLVGSRSVVREIVVGTDDSDEATAALEFSFAEADVRGARLTALYAWAHPEAGRLDGYHDWVLSVDPVSEGAASLLSGQVSPWRHKYPEVTVTESPVRGHPGRALTLASQSSDLVVVGGRRDLASATGLGPVTHAMLHHAQCPIAVIPGSALP